VVALVVVPGPVRKQSSIRSPMHDCVASSAKCDEVFLRIIPGLAAQFPVVNLEIRHGTATLAPPSVPAQHLVPQVFVQFGSEAQARTLYRNPVHDAFSVICSTNACRCSPGRNWKNRAIENKSTSGCPLSRLAPARKSAQIISRQ
jgi:hypothetical protein